MSAKMRIKLNPKELAPFKIREFRERARQRERNKVAKQEAAKIAGLISDEMLSDRTANDMTDMHFYGGLPFDVVVELYVTRCMPNMALNRYLEARQSA